VTETGRELTSSSPERHCRPGMTAAAERVRRTTRPRAAAFWRLLAGVAVTFAVIATTTAGELLGGTAVVGLGFRLPAGLHRAALVYCVAIAALIAVAAGSLMLVSGDPANAYGTQ
jgi:hypothetical protein